MNGIDAYQGEQSKNLGGDNLVASIKDPANLPFVGDVYVIGSMAYNLAALASERQQAFKSAEAADRATLAYSERLKSMPADERDIRHRELCAGLASRMVARLDDLIEEAAKLKTSGAVAIDGPRAVYARTLAANGCDQSATLADMKECAYLTQTDCDKLKSIGPDRYTVLLGFLYLERVPSVAQPE